MHLARSLLKSAAADGVKVGLYTRLPERIDALEQASTLIGVPCLAIQSQVLTADAPFVWLLQLDKMGVADAEISSTLKRLRVLADTVAGDSSVGSTKDLWTALNSLLALICVEAVVLKDRKMTVAEQADWVTRNECEGSGFLASKCNDTTAATEADAVLRQMLGEPSEDGSEAPTEATETAVDAVETGVGDGASAAKRQKTAPKSKPQSKLARERTGLRVPVEVELRRRTFYFDGDGNLLDPRKARCVKDGQYQPANQKASEAASEAIKVTGVDFVAHWRVFSAELGESIATRALLNKQMPLTTVEQELAALMPATESRFEVTEEQKAVFTAAAEGQGIKRLLHVTEKDGCRYVNEPIPAVAFAKELKQLRELKARHGNRLCSPQLLEDFKKASRGDRLRLEREHEAKAQGLLGPKRTSQLLWLEAVDRTAAPAAGGIRWLPVVYQKKKGFGRETASWPSLQNAEAELRRRLMHRVAHDWDLVSCHCFIVEAVVRGFLELDPEEHIPTLLRYNRSRAADVLANRGSAENEFLGSIAQWYGVTVGEAKYGPLVLLNQGSTTAWLKELEPLRAVPAKGYHPDLIRLQAEALGVRKLFFEHAPNLFPRGAFDGLRERLRADCPDGTLDSEEKMEKKLFSYCLMHLENVALHICTDASAKHGLPPLTDIYDGFLQLHVEGGDAAAVKRDAEAALLAHFKSPLYLVEKPFFQAAGVDGEEDDGIDHALIASAAAPAT